jgi:peptidoglycan/xylan/chitin deacetylase (PgdA/CDA1 family)
MLFHHVPSWVHLLFPQYVWHKSRREKTIYLTFDDGPVPSVTDFVLEELSQRGMKATFFMVGDNVVKHTDLARRVRSQGHQIGNHTHNHLNGRLCSTEEYLLNVAECQYTITTLLDAPSMLFRPPYGRMKAEQVKAVAETHQIIMWDVVSGDYDPKQSADRCLPKIKQYTRNGSIILFHDQKKTEKILLKVLPAFLDFIQAQGFRLALL